MVKESIIKEKKGANFFGFEAIDEAGRVHHNLAVIRGNGTLKLTSSALIFERWLPKKTFSIPLEKIEKIEIKRIHNLKTKLLPILRVYFAGQESFQILGVCLGFKKATMEWQEEIEKAMVVSGKNIAKDNIKNQND
ncbi:hypothetical protein HN784_01520 [bacterium]|jgi:hypothetical protein|nr:hypothetical protein [bacterium]MBT4250943.1 hypothetical protein [bacterium]MBT4597869.1 hypothetical protein [bacterium]MBT6753939.1 hypothetical protein [bacterium]MBT7037368.1 hypothetical protein [bacterium]